MVECCKCSGKTQNRTSELCIIMRRNVRQTATQNQTQTNYLSKTENRVQYFSPKIRQEKIRPSWRIHPTHPGHDISHSTIFALNVSFKKYRYASLNDGDMFSEIRRQAISSLCERHRAYLHKPRQYSLLHTQAVWYSLSLLGYKPVQHVTVLNTVGNCKTMVLH